LHQIAHAPFNEEGQLLQPAPPQLVAEPAPPLAHADHPINISMYNLLRQNKYI